MKTIKIALILFALMSMVLGILYPLAIAGIAQLVFPYKANGSLIYKQGKIIGSELIGQSFTSADYFHGRPSVVNYDGGASGASNYGPIETKWQEMLRARIMEIIAIYSLDSTQSIPVDLVTASASGLDPHISVQAAMLQVPQIAKDRGLDESSVRSLVVSMIEKPFIDVPYINVLKINLALDKLSEEHTSNGGG